MKSLLLLVLRLSRAGSVLLLLAGFVLPWYHVPVGLRQDATGAFITAFEAPWSTILFKILLAAVLLSALVYSWRKTISPPERARILAAAGLGALLLAVIGYPAFTIQRCAKVSAHGQWLEAQNESMILSNGDSLTGEEYAYQSGQPAVLITEVLPRSFQPIPTAQFNGLFDLHLAQLPQIVMWLGYTSGFCQFVSRGWFCVVFGALLLSVSFGRFGDGSNKHSLLKLGSNLLPAFAGGACLLWAVFLMPVLLAGLELNKAEQLADLGRYKDARKCLDRATMYLPVLAYTTDIVYQGGWFDRKLAVNSAASRLVTAIREEEEGFNDRATAHYADLLDPANPQPVRDEAYRGALRRALTDLNAGRDAVASDTLSRLLAVDPSCIKANYALQLADLRRHQKDALEQHVAQFESVYNTFQSLEKSALIATAHRRLAEADFDTRDIAHIGDDMRAAIKP